MQVKILSTTDGKNVGKTTEIPDGVVKGDTVDLFGLDLDVSYKRITGSLLVLASPNYVVRMLIKD